MVSVLPKFVCESMGNASSRFSILIEEVSVVDSAFGVGDVDQQW